MSFVLGFNKLAGDPVSFGAIGSALKKGLISSGGHKVSDALNPLKGAAFYRDAARSAGGAGKLFSTQKGREYLAEAVGKSAPNLVTGAAYAAAAKKVYNKLAPKDQGYENYGY